MKFWYLNEAYIEFLKLSEDGILNLHDEDYNVPKFCLGIVFKIEGFNYFAPVSSIKRKQRESHDDTVLKDFFAKLSYPVLSNAFGVKDELVASIKFNYMFPIHHKDLMYVNTDKFMEYNSSGYKFTKGYIALVNSEYSYCLKHKEEIQKKAKEVYDKAVSGEDNFDKHCLNFKLLEEEHLKWIMGHDAKAEVKNKIVFPIQLARRV